MKQYLRERISSARNPETESCALRKENRGRACQNCFNGLKVGSKTSPSPTERKGLKVRPQNLRPGRYERGGGAAIKGSLASIWDEGRPGASVEGGPHQKNEKKTKPSRGKLLLRII